MLRQQSNLQNKVSVSTVKRVLRKSNLFGRVAIRKPYLSKANIKKRLEWCSQKRNWNDNDWEKVIFTDEAKIELYPNRKTYVRRGPNESLKPKYVQRTQKFSPYIMIWGGMRHDGKRFLLLADGNVDSKEYQNILTKALPVLYSTRYLWQHDGAPCHRSASTSAFLQNRQIRILDSWPAQSPDLSPIENLWDKLKENVKNRHPQTRQELWNITKQEFESLPNEYIKKLYESMTRRIKAVINSKGNCTKY